VKFQDLYGVVLHGNVCLFWRRGRNMFLLCSHVP
jgi:hypothetical protein